MQMGSSATWMFILEPQHHPKGPGCKSCEDTDSESGREKLSHIL